MRFFDGINGFLNSVISLRPLSIEEIGRRKLLVVFFLMIIPADIAYGLLQFAKGLHSVAFLDLMLAGIMSFFVILLRYLEKGMPLYRTVILLYSMALVYFMQTGIVLGYGSLWAMFIPLFAFFLLGKREGSIWTGVFTAIMLALFINPYSYLSDFRFNSLFTSRFIPTYFMIVIFTYSYENVRERYKHAMEAEQLKLLQEKEKLAEMNRLLNEQIKMKELAEIELLRHRDHLEDIVAERTLEIKKNSEELKASEKRYRLMADNVNDLIWSTDTQLNFTFISPSVTRMYGYTVDEALALPHDKWNTSESYQKVVDAYRKDIELEKAGTPNPDQYIVLQLEQIRKDGTVFPVELKVSTIRDEDGRALGIVGITRDISDRIDIELEREKIKDQLAQSQKMEALGTLVGGLAHDFNNFLAGIIGSFDLLANTLKKETLNHREHIEKYLNLGIESSKRSAGLISQLLILSKKHEVKLSPLDLNVSLHHIYDLCKNSLPKSIELSFHFEKSPLVIMGDMVQIEQVLLNLCINASHAMTIMRTAGAAQGGILTVTAEQVRNDSVLNENYPETGSIKDWGRIRISDTGVGIDNDTRQRIFEPFFSTKNKNTSSGLGLAISYNIIKKHGGIVNVYSEPGNGSCFSIYFPIYTDGKGIIRDSAMGIVPGNGTILIIDDEPIILDIAEGFLKQCGYSILTADKGDRGIDVFKKRHADISAVIIDLSMPGKSGIEVFQALLKIDAKVKAVLSSGMLDNETKTRAIALGVKRTINKPYLAAELSAIIRSVITGTDQ